MKQRISCSASRRTMFDEGTALIAATVNRKSHVLSRCRGLNCLRQGQPDGAARSGL